MAYEPSSTKVTLQGQEIEITAVGSHITQGRLAYNVEVKAPPTRPIYFTYTDSRRDTQAGIEQLSEDNLIWALYCAVTDAAAAMDYDNIEDFRKEFYAPGIKSSTIRKSYETCQRMAEEFAQIGDIYGMANEMREKYEDIL